jgi:hypothetical protein
MFRVLVAVVLTALVVGGCTGSLRLGSMTHIPTPVAAN